MQRGNKSVLDYLQKDPMGFLLFMLYRAPAVLLALTFHEVAHGYVALRCGDPTAKLMHRLSLNPIKHMDPIGTASMFLLGFGWAKPVPVNPNNFKHGRRDDLLVSLAGVALTTAQIRALATAIESYSNSFSTVLLGAGVLIAIATAVGVLLMREDDKPVQPAHA